MANNSLIYVFQLIPILIIIIIVMSVTWLGHSYRQFSVAHCQRRAFTCCHTVWVLPKERHKSRSSGKLKPIMEVWQKWEEWLPLIYKPRWWLLMSVLLLIGDFSHLIGVVNEPSSIKVSAAVMEQQTMCGTCRRTERKLLIVFLRVTGERGRGRRSAGQKRLWKTLTSKRQSEETRYLMSYLQKKDMSCVLTWTCSYTTDLGKYI